MNAAEPQAPSAADPRVEDKELLQIIVSKFFAVEEKGITVFNGFPVGKKCKLCDQSPSPESGFGID